MTEAQQTETATTPRADFAARAYWFAALALSALFFAVSLAESLQKSPSSDEPPHIASGLEYVATGTFRGNPQHPPLLKELSGLSLLAAGIRWPKTPDTDFFLHGDWPASAQPEWAIGYQMIAAQPDRVMFWARLPLLLVSSLLGILVFLLGRELFGERAGLCAAILTVADPVFLGQSFMVTMDCGLTVFTILFFLALWRYLRNPTFGRLAWCGVALGLVLCVKFSAVLWLPVTILLLAAALIWRVEPEANRKGWKLDPFLIDPEEQRLAKAFQTTGRSDPCPCGSGKKFKACHGSGELPTSQSRLMKRAALVLVTFAILLLIAAVVIEAAYFFPKDLLTYVHGAQRVNADHRANYLAYMAGELEPRFDSYFTVTYLLKEPLAAIVLAAAGLVVLLRRKSITAMQRLFVLLPPALFFAGTMMLADQVGVRYIMPVLPFAHLAGGLALATLFTMRAPWGRYAGLFLCAWLVFAAAGVYPDHLSYFNESACLLTDPAKLGVDGGSKCGVSWLDDSNVDWGQGLKQLKAWLDQHAKGRTIELASFYAFPAAAYGIVSEKADVLQRTAKPSGLHVISASLEARAGAIPGADKRVLAPPLAIVGHAFYIFDFH